MDRIETIDAKGELVVFEVHEATTPGKYEAFVLGTTHPAFSGSKEYINLIFNLLLMQSQTNYFRSKGFQVVEV